MLRTLLRRPTTTLVVTTTLGIGLGAMGVIAALFSAVLFPSIPYRDADRLAVLWSSARPGAINRADYLTPRRADAWLATPPRGFDAIAAVGSATAVLRHDDNAQRIVLTSVTGSFFPMLGVSAQRGRMLTHTDSLATAAPAAVLSDRAWRKVLPGRCRHHRQVGPARQRLLYDCGHRTGRDGLPARYRRVGATRACPATSPGGCMAAARPFA